MALAAAASASSLARLAATASVAPVLVRPSVLSFAGVFVLAYAGVTGGDMRGLAALSTVPRQDTFIGRC